MTTTGRQPLFLFYPDEETEWRVGDGGVGVQACPAAGETDYLESTRWNFAYRVAARVDLDSHGRLLELGIHHWSDAWIRQPNRGQDFLTLSFGF